MPAGRVVGALEVNLLHGSPWTLGRVRCAAAVRVPLAHAWTTVERRNGRGRSINSFWRSVTFRRYQTDEWSSHPGSQREDRVYEWSVLKDMVTAQLDHV